MTNTLALAGKSVATGTSYPTDTLSLVSVLELQGTSPNESTSAGNVDAADIKYVGAASNLKAAGSITDTIVYIGIATYGEWSTPTFYDADFEIYFNTDDDEDDEYVLYNDAVTTSAGDATDIFVTTLENLDTGEQLTQDYLQRSACDD